ncbi:conserved hypothetical protein [Acidithiobacillus ferrooxidans ATCC 23270]|jgi:hypothetical protein|uniref:Uncharacterized protein n=1 Tax=Acidithiobacillus ferrooxidans (strain ATCC 23270 / DSM 14882 / CIP 104768 / NCIMB 8455) TaxID=243159 RepID=B7J6Q9_ACIF2|nr:conserved hypothetical protein [Acidithiobacillus ferrooxidans ATCC 23270]
MVRGVFVQRTESEQTTLNDLLCRYSKEVLPTLKGGYREQSRIKALQAVLGGSHESRPVVAVVTFCDLSLIVVIA